MSAVEPPSSTESYELGDDSSGDYSDASSVDPLMTDDEQKIPEQEETPSDEEEQQDVAAHGMGILVRQSLRDNGKPLEVCMQPARMSIYHGTAYVQDYAGGTIASMKTENSGLGIIMGVLGTAVASAVKLIVTPPSGAQNIAQSDDPIIGGGFVELRKAVTQYRKEKKTTNKTWSDTSMVFQQFLKTINLASSNRVAAGVGLGAALLTKVLRPIFSYQNASKRTQLSARWIADRKAFLITYPPQKGKPNATKMFVLKLNEEKRVWELFTETIESSRDVEIMLTQQDLEDDMKAPSVDAAESAERQKEEESLALDDEKQAGSGGEDQPVDLMGEDDGYDSDASVVDLSTPDLETPKLESESRPSSELENKLVDEAESHAPDLEIPVKWKRGTEFKTPDDNFVFSVENFTRLALNFGEKRLVMPFAGASEKYKIDFKGPTSVPRDVLVFASYIVRQSNVLPFDLLLVWALLIGNDKIVWFLLTMISWFFQRSSYTKRFDIVTLWQNSNKAYAKWRRTDK